MFWDCCSKEDVNAPGCCRQASPCSGTAAARKMSTHPDAAARPHHVLGLLQQGRCQRTRMLPPGLTMFWDCCSKEDVNAPGCCRQASPCSGTAAARKMSTHPD